MDNKNILVTGGCGFIGSNFIRHMLSRYHYNITNLDKLTYAGNLENLKDIENDKRYSFIKGDIVDRNLVQHIFEARAIDTVINFAAESHVDRSIDGPMDFIQTNIIGTYNLLEVARNYWQNLTEDKKSRFKFHHISTDEVYGDLEGTDDLFTEETSYSPSSPYSASKASSDHLVRAWYRTYGLPVVVTNCSNNYGPYHFPEKLIPLVILNALDGKPLPVYGDGKQIRDWLYVEDHARALYLVATTAKVGETYNIGGHNEKQNIDVVKTICTILDNIKPRTDGQSYTQQITFVKDRPGHDLRYAIDASKIQQQLNWQPQETFESGIQKTVEWYLSNQGWVNHVKSGEYQHWVEKQYQ